MKFGQTSEKMVKIVKHHGLVWFVWFDLGLRALNFNTVSQSLSNMVYQQGGHRAARAAKKKKARYQTMIKLSSARGV